MYLKIPKVISWMIGDISDVEPMDEKDSPTWQEMHMECNRTKELKTPIILSLSTLAAWELIDEFEMLNNRDSYFDDDKDEREFQAAKRKEAKAIEEIKQVIIATGVKNPAPPIQW